VISGLKGSELKALTHMVDQTAEFGEYVWSDRKLHLVLRDEGHRVGRDTISRHRAGHPA
jgi:hypothetical protein